MFAVLYLSSTLLDPMLYLPSAQSDLLFELGSTPLVNPFPLSVPLLYLFPISLSESPLDGDDDFVGDFNGDVTNVDPDEDVIVFDTSMMFLFPTKMVLPMIAYQLISSSFYIVVLPFPKCFCSYIAVCDFFRTFFLLVCQLYYQQCIWLLCVSF